MDPIEKYLLKPENSIVEAYRKLDLCVGFPLYVVSDGILVGSVTDGDLRRYILSGGSLDGQVKSAMFPQPYKIHSRKMSLRKGSVSVPLVDQDNRLLDIIFKDTTLVASSKLSSIEIVINAGGSGSRLRPYTQILPKPLIPVGDTPVLEIIMEHFTKFGAKSFSIVVNYKKEIIKSYFSYSDYKNLVDFIDEDKPLGTGGGLYLAKEKLRNTFIFSNCDIVIRADYADMLEFHGEEKNIVTIVTSLKQISVPYGVVKLDDEGLLHAFEEKPTYSNLVNTGFYIVEPEIFNYMQPNTSVDFPTVINRLLENKKRVGVYPISEDAFLDMGIPEEMERMRKLLGVD